LVIEAVGYTLTIGMRLIVAGIIIGSAYALGALGLTLIWGGARIINYAHGELVMIGAYVSFWLFTAFKVPPPLAIPFAAGVAAVIGLGLYLGTIGRLTRAPEEMESYGLILTFALMILLSNSVAWMFTSDIQVYRWMMVPIDFFAVSTLLNRLMIPIICLPVAGIVLALMNKTWFGRGISLVIDNDQVAGLVGVNVRNAYFGILTIGTITPAIAGLAWSFNYPFSPFIGIEHAILAFVVVILGGLGSPKGSIVGGLLIGIIETTLVYLISPGLRLAIAYSIFILVILLRPSGLFGRK